jgi:hypothetical protein
MDTLKERTIYSDTDSVIYIQKCGQPPAVTCGDKLGDMSNWLGLDEYIEEFVSGGPKNYSYRMANARTLEKETVCKVRGITLNYAAAQLVNFDNIRHMILNADAGDVIIVRTERKVKRKTRKCDGSGLHGADTVPIVSKPEEKVYRISFNKRRRLENQNSVPLEYVKDGQGCSTSICVKFFSVSFLRV